VLASTFLALPAFAQTAVSNKETAPTNAAAAANEVGLSDIVVTGTRKSRAEALQDVAVSVSAFSGEQIEAARVINLTDIGRLTPGARLESNGTFPAATNFFVRGAGVNTTNPSDDPTVGVFVDGMYLGVNVGALTDLFDVESIEVLRGPQGTLFGRNVTGGAVLVRSRRPTGDFGVRGEIGYGSFDEKVAKVAVEGPLVEGSINAKLAVLYRDHDGYFSNAASPKNRIGASENLIFRPMLEFKPTDRLTITLIGEVGTENDDGTPTKNILIKPAAVLVTPPVPTGKFDLTANLYAHTDTDWRQIIGEGVLEVGSGRITTTLSYRKLKVDDQTEIDGTTAPLFQFNDPTGLRQDQRTAEIVYAGSIGDTIDLTLGGNIFDQHVEYQENRSTASNTATGSSAGRGILDHTAGGVFAQGDWRFAPTFTVTFGGRYTIERKHARVANFGQCSLNFATCTYGTDDAKTWRDFTPKAAIKWEPSRDLTFYASYTRGFRSGGYNLRNSVGLAGPYDPESVDAYEAGVKTVAFDRRLRANLAFYRNDFKDLQRQILDSAARQRILNAASARIQGIELDLTTMPVNGLTLGGTLAYTDAKYNEYNGLDLTGDGIPDPALARNLKLTRIPKFTYSLFGTYEASIADAGSLALQVGFDHTGRRALNETNSYFLSAFGLLDASLTFTTSDKRFKLSVFGKNLTNKLYASTGVDVGTFRSVYIGAPRRYGASFGFQF
jgi:outer membrane receptor protein involved in Fe transport